MRRPDRPGGTRLRAGPLLSGAIPLLAVVLVAASCGDRGQSAAARDLPSAGERPSGQELPDGATPAMVARGEEIFRGAGFCYNCHGRDGTGLPQLGSDLTSGLWHHSDGSYAALVERIDRGVTAERSRTGMPMPPRGGARLTDEQVRSVAAYVWTLSRR